MDQEYVFNVGDEVIDEWGRCGKIVEICDCDRCKMNGWYEPEVEYNGHYNGYITHWDRGNGFSRYYKIGKYVFGNIDLDYVNERIFRLEEQLAEEYAARDVLLGLIQQSEVN